MRRFFITLLTIVLVQGFIQSELLTTTNADQAGFGQQPPKNMKTIRTYLTPSGEYSKKSSDAVKVCGFSIGFWGSPDCPILDKHSMIQDWECGNTIVSNGIFPTREEAIAFLRNPNREAIAGGWRAKLNTKKWKQDPSLDNAQQRTSNM